MATLSFSIATSAFDQALVPAEARHPGTPAFREAVNTFLQNEFKDFGGTATIRVDDRNISVVWDPEAKQLNPLIPIVQKLQQGKQAEGIQLLELLLSSRPDDPGVLYNLGVALSDAGRLERAEQCLRLAVELKASDTNIRVALGVALGRMDKDDEAVKVFQTAIAQDAKNPWAHRNLAGMLMKAAKPDEAISHYQTTTQIQPNDQIAWLGLADACRLTGRTKEAEDAYRSAVKINPHSDLAEKARAGSNLMAQSGFDNLKKSLPRQDAVQYCLDALQTISTMSTTDVLKLALDLAMAGRNGLEVNNPSSRYRVKGLQGEFSGLALVCFLYVVMQQIAPEANVGMDLSEEYRMARKLFDRPKS
jgi:Flp pilus assembly protein TadD